MQKELEEIKQFILNAPLPELRHGMAKLIDYIDKHIINKKVVTSKKEKSQGE